MDNKQFWSNAALNFFVGICSKIVIESDEQRAHMIALGYIIRNGCSDKDAILRTRELGYSITLDGFRKWLPQFMAEFGEAARGK